MALPITIPHTFATATGSLPLSQLDTDFNTVATAVNGIADGTNALPNVNITGGGVANAVVTNASIINATYSGQPFSPTGGFRRNRIINGAMQVDQRNNGAAQTITTAGAYTVDRWVVTTNGASTTGQRVAGPTGYQYAYQINGAASLTGMSFSQRIESYNVADLVNQNVTLSVVISNTSLTSVTWTAAYANATDNFNSVTVISTGTFTVSSSETQYTATFNAGANAANGILIQFSVGAQTSGNWKVTGVQLEPGNYATPFEQLSIGETLALCQRYYEIGDWLSSGQAVYYTVMVFYKVTKRASATVTNSRSLATFGGVTGTSMFYQNAIDASPQNATFTASAEL
jgi:hypothetical protein